VFCELERTLDARRHDARAVETSFWKNARGDERHYANAAKRLLWNVQNNTAHVLTLTTEELVEADDALLARGLPIESERAAFAAADAENRELLRAATSASLLDESVFFCGRRSCKSQRVSILPVQARFVQLNRA